MGRTARRSFVKWGMTMSERNPYEFEKIPDFAMQPAREDAGGFDPELYERLLAGLVELEPEEEALSVEAALQTEPAVETVLQTEPTVQPATVATAPPAEPATAATAPPQAAAELPPAEISTSAAELPPAETSTSAAPLPPAETPAIRGEVIPVGEGLRLDSLQLVEMTPCSPVLIRVEEDILVPDIKPDLESILSMDGALQFTERDGKISGDLVLQTLYVPQGKGADRTVVDMESRIAFRQEAPLGAGLHQAAGTHQTGTHQTGANSSGAAELRAVARVESLEHSVVNERKYRVKAVIAVEGRRYGKRELELFEGLEGEDVQLLQEAVTVTDVTLRKREPLELEENLPLPDSLPEPERILRCSVTLVENHKQINRDKAVVSGTAYYTILYQPKGEDAITKELGATTKEPVLFQAKSEFTQFVPLGRKNESGEGRIFFRVTKASAEPRDNESGIKNTIRVNVEGETFLEVYREAERRIVTDAYHPKKELVFDTETVELMQLGLCGIGETTVREVINIPERISGIQRLTYVSGDVVSFQSKIEHGKNVVEGKAEVRLVGLSDEEKPTPFDMVRQLPFRIALDLPAGLSNPAAATSPLGAATAPPAASLPDNDVVLKELRCDRLNDRQVEVNAVIQMNGAVIRKKQCPLIRNVGFVEETGPQQERPGLVLYISRRGDTLWNIARKYRTTMEAVASINQIPVDGLLEVGTKLLIVK